MGFLSYPLCVWECIPRQWGTTYYRGKGGAHEGNGESCGAHGWVHGVWDRDLPCTTVCLPSVRRILRSITRTSSTIPTERIYCIPTSLPCLTACHLASEPGDKYIFPHFSLAIIIKVKSIRMSFCPDSVNLFKRRSGPDFC